MQPLLEDKNKTVIALQNLANDSANSKNINGIVEQLQNLSELNRKDIFEAINASYRLTISEKSNARAELVKLHKV